MNSTDPLAPPGGPGYGMRAFIVLMLLVIAFLLFANGALNGLDLTSNTPGSTGGASAVQAAAPQQAPVVASEAPQVAPQVITIQESPSSSNQSGGVVPVTGSCSDPYTVQPGDSLLQIATVCNTSLAAIRQANPQITDANLIYPGQKLHIPGASAAVQPTLVVPVTSNQTNQATPAANTIQIVTPTPTALIPATGAYPMIPAGTGLQVKAIGYPANTPVNIAVGPQSQGYTLVANAVTDANGDLTTHINVPQAQNAQTPYVVVVATTGTPQIQAMSQPFFIGPTGSSNP